MPRLRYLDRKDLAPQDQDLPRSRNKISRALAHSPKAARNLNELATYLQNGSDLDPRLRELATLQVGYVLRAEYQYANHLKVALAVGVPEEDIRAIALETAGKTTKLEPVAKAVLSAARQLSTRLTLSDETFAELKQYLGERELLDLFVTIGNYNSVVCVLAALQVELEDDYPGLLRRFPIESDVKSLLRPVDNAS